MRKLLMTLILSALSISAETIAHTSVRLSGVKTAENSAIITATLTPEKGWHTYWSNPGDAGMTPYLELKEESLERELQELPIPKRYEMSGLVAYGYDKEVAFRFHLSGEIPDVLEGSLRWLACDKGSCVPGSKEFSLALKEQGASPTEEKVSAARGYPVKLKVSAHPATKQGDGWSFSFTSEEKLKGWTVLPYNENFSELNGEEKVRSEDGKYTFSFDCLGELPQESSFLLYRKDKGYVITF